MITGNITRIFSVLLLGTVLAGCATPKPAKVKTELDCLFENNFVGIEVPEPAKIKEGAEKKEFPYVRFEEVWDAVLVVLIQQGIVVRTFKDSGVIIAVSDPPTVLYVDHREPVTVYLNWLGKFYGKKLYRLSTEDLLAGNIKRHSRPDDLMAKILLERFATQIYVREKWKYLYKK